MKFLMWLLVIVPFPVLALTYAVLPTEIPLFVDLLGNPTISVAKSALSVFRLPVMGLLFVGLCNLLMSSRVRGWQQEYTRIWQRVGLLAALKMSMTAILPALLLYAPIYFVAKWSINLLVLWLLWLIASELFTIIRHSNWKILSKSFEAWSLGKSFSAIVLCIGYFIVAFGSFY